MMIDKIIFLDFNNTLYFPKIKSFRVNVEESLIQLNKLAKICLLSLDNDPQSIINLIKARGYDKYIEWFIINDDYLTSKRLAPQAEKFVLIDDNNIGSPNFWKKFHILGKVNYKHILGLSDQEYIDVKNGLADRYYCHVSHYQDENLGNYAPFIQSKLNAPQDILAGVE